MSVPPRTAFVLSGGAALGAIQAGMLRAIYERGIEPDLIVGTSVGALNGAYIASRSPLRGVTHGSRDRRPPRVRRAEASHG